MEYQPKIIFNPTDEEQEFMYDHRVYVFKPFEKRNLNGEAAFHVLKHVNGPLKEYVPGDENNVVESNVAYDKMKYRDLVSLASKRGVYEFKMKKDQIIAALEEADGQED